MKKRILIPVIIFSFFSLHLQAQLAMGKWRTHFAYNSVSQIAQSDNKIYGVSEGALFSVDKQDGGLEFYSKISGLNGTNISQIEFDNSNKQLLIVYSNGNIDLLGNGGVTNIPDLFNKQMSASKTVNQVQFYDNKAYLSCDFGIVVLNMDKKEVVDTYYIGMNATEVQILNTTIQNSSIYAVTTSTVYKASINEPFLVNYQNWSTITDLPGSGDYKKMISFANQLFLLRGGKLYKQDSNDTWTSFLPGSSVTNLSVSNGSLNIFTSDAIYLVDNSLNTKNVSGIGTLTDAEYDPTENTYWFAANELGIISYKQAGTETPTISYYKPAGPAVNIPWDMTFSGEKLFVVPGGRWSSQYLRDGDVMMYNEGIWTNIYAKDIKSVTGYDALDFMNIAVDPVDNKHFFVTSYGTGLYEFKDGKLENWYTHLNSKLESALPNSPYNYIRLDGAIFDQSGNLWMNNIGKIKILMNDGKWEQLYYTNLDKPTLGKIMISKLNPNQKWMPSVRYSPGICVFDDNGTITDQSDDKTVFISAFIYPETDINNNTDFVSVTPGAVYTIVQDLNGVVWVGTDQGPFLFNNLSNVFDSNYTCSRVKIPRNDSTNQADYLLKGEKIKAIAIDGANRKWLGTETSGVYLMSENGQETIKHFTISNSPLLSNDIISIGINPVSGEVFFGTGNGIVSYQSDAAIANESFTNVHAYPNPVRENYTGVITITGLVPDTQVKITDLNGNLICETVSNGSIATWDGKDVHGRRVSTGIYLAICVNSDGTQSTITKIMVIN